MHLDYHQRPPTHTLIVWGEHGRAELDFATGSLRWVSTDGQIESERVPDGFERNTMFIDEIKHFLECVEVSKPTCIPLSEGISVLEIALNAKKDSSHSSQ